MPKLKSMQDLLIHNLKDIYSAETQLVRALPEIAKAASDPSLVDAVKKHLEETKVHVERLERIAEILEITPRGVSCKAMKGLVEECQESIEEEGEPYLKDLGLIAAAQKVEHYEISAYGTARALAVAAGNQEIADILQTTLDEEGATDKNLTTLAEQIVVSSGAGA
jgi:ferritin-like metal-binding protein YciE